jgi:hypothetical protein
MEGDKPKGEAYLSYLVWQVIKNRTLKDCSASLMFVPYLN